MEPIAESHAMYQSANNHFWTGIRASYAGHPFTTLLFGEIIHRFRQF
jgi:hypothetical protein